MFRMLVQYSPLGKDNVLYTLSNSCHGLELMLVLVHLEQALTLWTRNMTLY
jgi:hypothetical protein